MTSRTSHLDSPEFNAQHVANRLLRAATRPDAPETLRGYVEANKPGAKDALFGEALSLDIPRDDRRVKLVCQWIDMNSGVARDAVGWHRDAEQAIQTSASQGSTITRCFDSHAHSHLMTRAARFTEYPRMHMIEFVGNELGRDWCVRMSTVIPTLVVLADDETVERYHAERAEGMDRWSDPMSTHRKLWDRAFESRDERGGSVEVRTFDGEPLFSIGPNTPYR